MGADLYIKQLHDPVVKKYGPLFEKAVAVRDHLKAEGDRLPKKSEIGQRMRSLSDAAQELVTFLFDGMYEQGYFRDSYNATSVLWRLGLSWWKDVIPLCDDKHNLAGENLHRLRDMVAQAELRLPTKEELKENGAEPDKDGNGLEEWHNYYREKRETLLAFLNQAIELNTAVYCSL